MPRVIPQLSGMLKPVMCQRRGLRPSLPDSSTWIQTASLDSHISGEPNEVCSTSAGETGSGCTLITIETVHLNFRRQKGKLPESERCIDSYSTIIKICALFLESENWRNYRYFVVSNFKQWDREKKTISFCRRCQVLFWYIHWAMWLCQNTGQSVHANVCQFKI